MNTSQEPIFSPPLKFLSTLKGSSGWEVPRVFPAPWNPEFRILLLPPVECYTTQDLGGTGDGTQGFLYAK